MKLGMGMKMIAVTVAAAGGASIRKRSIFIHGGSHFSPFMLLIKGGFHSDSNNHKKSPYQTIKNIDEGLNLFSHMIQQRPLPAIYKFNQLLNSISKFKGYDVCIKIFKELCVQRVRSIDIYTTNTLTKCFCDLCDTTSAYSLLGFAIKAGYQPDIFTYTTLLNGLVTKHSLLEAETFFDKLIQKGICEPNVHMYTTMIKGLCRFGLFDKAIKMLRLMLHRGCPPNLVTYSTIIDGLCKTKKVDDAVTLYKEMISNGRIEPDALTYNSLIYGFCVFSRYDEVNCKLREMQQSGVKLDIVTYTTIIDSLCTEGKVANAMQVFSNMITRGVLPDVIVYGALIDGFCLIGQMSKARAVFDSMVSHGLIPDVVCYNSMVNGYCKASELHEATNLFSEMSYKKVVPDSITYNSMLHGLFQAGHVKTAHKLFNGMPAHNQATYRILLEGLCIHRLIDQAFSLFDLLAVRKLHKDINLYNILIDGASKCGKTHLSSSLFTDMLLHGPRPDIVTYNSMISGFCRERMVNDAFDLFLKMTNGPASVIPEPDTITYKLLAHSFARNNPNDGKLKKMLQHMSEKGFLFDISSVRSLAFDIDQGKQDPSLLNLIGKVTPKL